MVKRTYDFNDEEPESFRNELPSEGNHIFQVVDIFTSADGTGIKLNLGEDDISVKLEVAKGPETGLSLLHRLTLDENHKGFFATRLFLKAVGQPHKGKGITIDTDIWIGEQFQAYITHNKGKNGKVYANIDTYILDDSYDPSKIPDPKPLDENQVVEWDEGKT